MLSSWVGASGLRHDPVRPANRKHHPCFGGTLSSFFFFFSFSMAGAKPKTPRSVFFAWPVSSFHGRGAKPTPRCDLSFFCLSLLRLRSQSPQQPPCLPRELDFPRVSFLFMNRPTLSRKDLLKATRHGVCVCVCVDHLFAKVTCAGGHSTYYQGMANEEPGSMVR